jgi:Lipocalin-like domain
MKKINFKFYIVLLFSVLIVSCSDDKKSSTEPDLDIDPAMVGTWDLTKITSATFGEFTPAQLGLSFTSTFNSDGTFESTTIDVDGTVVDTGTWGSSGGVLTINIEGEDPENSAYTIEGNIATLDSTVPFQGVDIPATLEFTKRM